jgi:hypothetical protein
MMGRLKSEQGQLFYQFTLSGSVHRVASESRNPGRRSSYRRGDSVQTTRAGSRPLSPRAGTSRWLTVRATHQQGAKQ